MFISSRIKSHAQNNSQEREKHKFFCLFVCLFLRKAEQKKKKKKDQPHFCSFFFFLIGPSLVIQSFPWNTLNTRALSQKWRKLSGMCDKLKEV